MRLAFWRAGKAKAVVQGAEPKSAPRPMPVTPPVVVVAPKRATAAGGDDLDLRVFGQALARKRGWIIVPTVLALVLSVAAVNLITPRYKSESRILIDGRENVFCVPVNRASSMLAGVLSTGALALFASGRPSPATELVGAGLMLVAVAVLALPRRARRAAATSS